MDHRFQTGNKCVLPLHCKVAITGDVLPSITVQLMLLKGDEVLHLLHLLLLGH